MPQRVLTKPAPFGAISVYRAVSAISDLASGIGHWRSRNRTATQLARLSDRQLDDIGLSRGDVETIAAGRYF